MLDEEILFGEVYRAWYLSMLFPSVLTPGVGDAGHPSLAPTYGPAACDGF